MKRCTAALGACFALMLAPVLASAQAVPAVEARQAEPPTEPPRATLEDVTWLVGSWEGTDSEGDRVIERWLPPIGKLMVGTFVQTVRTESGEIGVESTEHMHLWEEGGTLHFASMSIEMGADPMIGRRKLVAIKPCELQFEDMTMRCSDPEQPGTGLVVVFPPDEWSSEKEDYIITYTKAGETQPRPLPE